MKKNEIIERLSQMSETDLNEVLDVYRKHRPVKADGRRVITVPDYINDLLSKANPDKELLHLIEELPTHLTSVDPPSRELVERCKRIYTDECLCFDETGELFVQMVLEYASSYKSTPLILYGAPGCGKSHRAKVLSKMLGLPLERVDIPLAAHGSGLSGEGGSYRNASMGILAKGMYKTKSCNYLLNLEELDKEEKTYGRPSFSDQFLKILDQDATRFVDNRLGFEIDVSHIVYVFTANDRSKIPAPMLDRCNMVELRTPSKDDIEGILRGAVIPKTIESVCAKSEIAFSEEAIDFILHAVWKGEDTSIRQYQSLVSKCVSAANYTCICEGRPVTIQASDAETQLRRMSPVSTGKNRIGFT